MLSVIKAFISAAVHHDDDDIDNDFYKSTRLLDSNITDVSFGKTLFLFGKNS